MVDQGMSRLLGLNYFFFFSLESLEPLVARVGMATRVRTAGVTYAAFFNRSLRLVRVSKTARDFCVGIKPP